MAERSTQTVHGGCIGGRGRELSGRVQSHGYSALHETASGSSAELGVQPLGIDDSFSVDAEMERSDRSAGGFGSKLAVVYQLDLESANGLLDCVACERRELEFPTAAPPFIWTG